MKNEISKSVALPIEKIQSMIVPLHGVQVMFDGDLAALYGVDVKRLNQQVNRNIERFSERLMHQLTAEEFENLKSQIATSSWGGVRKPPKVFTEQGISMLVLDDKEIYLIGASLKDLGKKCFAFTKLDAGEIAGLKARI